VVAFLSLVFLFPVNESGRNVKAVAIRDQKSYTPGFPEWTTSNLEDGDGKLWVSAAAVGEQTCC
jgi:hypothetical protein